MKELFDETEVRKTLGIFTPAGCVFEVRALKARFNSDHRRKGTISGYFDNHDPCVAQLRRLDEAEGIYSTMNPVDPALLSRRANRLDYVEAKDTTADQHILTRCWMVLDFDFKRPSGTSATDGQKKQAGEKALQVRDFLTEEGWPAPVIGNSGNGYHLRYRIDLPSDDDGLIQNVLVALGNRFDGDGVEIDRAVFNPARIVRLYGTLAAKGDDTQERPHRMSKILKAPILFRVGTKQLEALVQKLQPEESAERENVDLRQGSFDVDEFLTRYGIEAERTTEPDGTIKWLLAHCPFNHDHTNGEAAVFQDANGKLGFKCFHSSCADKHWSDFRQHFEPESSLKSTRRTAAAARRDDGEWPTDLSSFTSLDEARFPAPLEDDAYYGLAGKIVQRILPETEADPAALLFTLLTGFGNMIGRTAYMIADGARHYLNLFVVTVGRTSISRKRTAWVHVRRVLESINADWVRQNVESGLSSGEGIVHRIRDKIDEEKPVKEKGKWSGNYETVTVDPGVDDKRLFILETEFCSPLKVMNREGNTLSPVLRAAWDGDDLGTLTKNSRERATKPLISMIGHITREELRRNLNETEAANGFGNRILWAAARRSKILPRGGSMPAIADFIAQLEDALLDAQTCGELMRDDDAEQLWAKVYPELSEDKAGLLGAIIGRAAPQVVRLSEIYAVLDRAKQIRVEHLKAALACWRYAEASARWIFETGTGSKVADRILAALIAAGATGLTKTQIVSDVFNRNVTKFTIDEALRLLHHLSLAFCKKYRVFEGTKGRLTEYWFSKSIDELNERNEQKEGD